MAPAVGAFTRAPAWAARLPGMRPGVDHSRALDLGVVEAVRVAAGGVDLDADVLVPADAVGLILFAHGSGSGRRSPRTRYVAEALHEHGLATALVDLLTPDEALEDARGARHRFDVPLLAARLLAATQWLGEQADTRALPLGCFGASTGAAAALSAAADAPQTFATIVCRGGRPDLVPDALAHVKAPTLLLVGSEDTRVLQFNVEAAERLPDAQVVVIPGAGHLFEEPGALERVSRLAADWFGGRLAQTVTRSER